MQNHRIHRDEQIFPFPDFLQQGRRPNLLGEVFGEPQFLCELLYLLPLEALNVADDLYALAWILPFLQKFLPFQFLLSADDLCVF